MYPEFKRPRVRADCKDVPRPCPFVACRYNLYLDVHPKTGSIKYNFPDLDPTEMDPSCALDIAARGGETLDSIAGMINVTRERIRQLEEGLVELLYHDEELCDAASTV